MRTFKLLLAAIWIVVWPAHQTNAQWVNSSGPYDVYALAVTPDGSGGTNVFAGTYVHGVFLWTNNAGSWSTVNSGLPKSGYGLATYPLVSTFAVSPNGAGGTNLFAGTFRGVFRSSNNGISWTAVNTGLTNTTVWALAISGMDLFAGTEGGVWRRPLSEMITSVKELHTSVPEGYTLQQNYPNPFNPSTTIRFSLPKSGYVTLKVYNILGREVETLVDGVRAAGSCSVEWTPSSLASGVYLYRIEAGAFSVVKRLLLLR
jgi:hypothetical protein